MLSFDIATSEGELCAWRWDVALIHFQSWYALRLLTTLSTSVLTQSKKPRRRRIDQLSYWN